MARQVCMSAGMDVVLDNEGARRNLRILHEPFAPDEVDGIYQEAVQFLHFKGADQTAEVFLLEFDVLRRRAESRAATGGGFPGEFVPAQRMKNASLSKNEISLVSASILCEMVFAAAARQMHQLFGSFGSVARQDVSVAVDVDVSSVGESEHAAWLAYRQAKNKKDFARTEEDDAKKVGKKGKVDGKTLNGFNRRMGERNRRFERNSEYHPAPNGPSRYTREEAPAPSAPMRNKPPRPP